MFRKTLVILFWNIISNMNSQTLSEKLKSVRSDFEKNKDNPSQCLIYIKKLEDADEPELKGYQAMYTFMMAKHALDPFSKWHYFNKGKKILENVIAQHPKNIELKFLRFMIQTHIPSLLGYNNNIQNDKKEIILALKNKKITDIDLAERIKQSLKNSSYLTNDEKQIL